MALIDAALAAWQAYPVGGTLVIGVGLVVLGELLDRWAAQRYRPFIVPPKEDDDD